MGAKESLMTHTSHRIRLTLNYLMKFFGRFTSSLISLMTETQNNLIMCFPPCTASCRPCNDTEVLMAACSSDFGEYNE